MPMKISGMEAVIAAFKRREAGADAAIQKAVKAGGSVLAKRIAADAPVYHGPPKSHVTPGALRDSIRAGSVQYNAADGYYVEVKPVGNMPGTEESLAKIGNIVEYGRSNADPRPFFHPAIQKAESDVDKVIADTFEREMGGG